MHTRDADVYETILIMIRRRTRSERMDLEGGEGEGAGGALMKSFPALLKETSGWCRRGDLSPSSEGGGEPSRASGLSSPPAKRLPRRAVPRRARPAAPCHAVRSVPCRAEPCRLPNRRLPDHAFAGRSPRCAPPLSIPPRFSPEQRRGREPGREASEPSSAVLRP